MTRPARRRRWTAVAIAISAVALARAPRATAQPPGEPAPIPISIEAAIRAAEDNSNLVDAALADQTAAAAQVTVARSEWFPQVALAGSYIRTLLTEYDAVFDVPVTPDDGQAAEGGAGFVEDLPFGRDHIWSVNLSATQLVYDFGRASANIAAARARASRAEVEVTSQRALAVIDVTEAYYDAVLAEQLVRIAEASLELAEETLRLTRVGYEEGTTPEFEVLRAEVTRDEQQVTVLDNRAARELAMIRLRRLLGLPLDRAVVLTSALDADASVVLAVATDTARIAGLDGRAPVVQARLDVDASRAQARAAEAQLFPTLSLFSDAGVVNYPADFVPTSDWRANWTVGVSVSFPVFTGYAIEGQIRAARAQARAARARLEETAELAAVDERDIELVVRLAEASLQVSARSTRLARRAYEIADVRYREGVSTYLELIDTRLALARAASNEARAARDLRVARVRRALLPALPLGLGAVQRAPAAGATAVPTATTPADQPDPTSALPTAPLSTPTGVRRTSASPGAR